MRGNSASKVAVCAWADSKTTDKDSYSTVWSVPCEQSENIALFFSMSPACTVKFFNR